MTQAWSIRARLTVWYAGLLILVLVVLGAVIYARFSAMFWIRAERSLHAHFDQVASLVDASETSAPGRSPLADLSDRRVIESMSATEILIEIDDANGNPVSRSRALGARSVAPPGAVLAALAGRSSLQSATVPGVGAFLVYTAPLRYSGSLVGVAQVGVPFARVAEPLNNLRRVFLIGGTAALAVIVLGGYLIASQGLAPIDRITSTARAIASNGALDHRLRPTGPNDEVGRLAGVFDEMLERIEQVVKRERRFTADAAHELRTPLTILKGEIDVALRHERSPAEYRSALREVADETDRLTRLVDGLLLLARADAGAVTLTPQSVHIAEIAWWVEGQFAQLACDRQISLRVDPTDAMVWGDPHRLRQLVTNLVNNAIAHTPPGGTVSVGWRSQGSGTLLEVTDTGYGIAAEDLPHVFERFYRGGPRNVAVAGAGLGLAIAKWIAQAHQGTTAIASEQGRGTTVSVWLPASFDALAQSRLDYWWQSHDDPEPV